MVRYNKCGVNRRKEYFISEKTGKEVSKCAVCRGLVEDATSKQLAQKPMKTNNNKNNKPEEDQDEYEDFSESQSSGSSESEDEIYCDFCNKTFDSQAQVVKHLSSATHRRNMEKFNSQN